MLFSKLWVGVLAKPKIRQILITFLVLKRHSTVEDTQISSRCAELQDYCGRTNSPKPGSFWRSRVDPELYFQSRRGGR